MVWLILDCKNSKLNNMKKIISILSVALICFSTDSFAQDAMTTPQKQPKIIAVVNRAKWCPTCKANEARIMAEVIPAIKKMDNVDIVLNDLSDKATKAESKIAIEKMNIYDIIKNKKATGVIYLISVSDKKIIKEMYVSETTEKLLEEIKLTQ
jgi:hypothetical protein